MEAETFSNGEVVRASNEKFVNVKVDTEAQPELWDKFGRGKLPATFVTEPEGEVITTIEGFRPADSYARLLEKVELGYANIKKARSMVAKDPDDAAGQYLLGEAYLELGNRMRAEGKFKKVIDIGASAAELSGELRRYVAMSHERFARLLTYDRRTGDAKRHIEVYRRLDAKNEYGREDNASLTEGLVLTVDGAFDASAGKLNAALEKFPDSDEADLLLLALGVAQHEAGNKGDALKSFRRLVREHPKSDWKSTAEQAIESIQKQLEGDK